jgi:YfiH family protein
LREGSTVPGFVRVFATCDKRTVDDALLTAGVLAGFAHGFSLRNTDLERAFARLGIARPYQASQVHGADVAVAEGDPARVRATEADALVARAPGAAVAVRIADCVPVLVASDAGVAAIHAGWRGVVRGVIPAALRALGGARRVAAIGPCIGPCCFEVGADVADQIAVAARAEVVARREGDKAYVDLRRAVRAILDAEGVTEIEDVPGCTKHEPERFFSFRRDGSNAGRLVGIIAARA